MKLTLWRLLLSPLTCCRARRLQQKAGTGMSFDAAWRQARMLTAPDEMVYRLHGHQFPLDAEDGTTRSETNTHHLP
ncbi:hypothetical protein [Streptomyces peucetius]|nr:hypothetical protein CGZ69_00180 [Streptomyces peucetius subsp. caesius ATCC 27952]